MNPEDPANQTDAKLQDVYNPLKVMQPNERVVCEIKRHPVGLIGLYLSVGLVIVVVIVAAALVPHYMTNTSQQARVALFAGGLIVAVIALLYGYIGSIIYKANRWVVTSDSITQISQVGLFHKQSSQLSLANLEDVTVGQNGLLQSLFGFGTLHVETAGERSKFVFPFCPKPNDFAKMIIAAHEEYIAAKPEEMLVTNRPIAAAPSFNQSAPQLPYDGPPMQPNPTAPPAEGYQPPAEQPYPPDITTRPPAGPGEQ